MRKSTALTRGERAEREAPAERLLTRASQELDKLIARIGGEDFERRLRALRGTESGSMDPFGFDPEWAKYALASAAFFHRYYFRVKTYGIADVPPGRVLLVANHSGQLPIDGALIVASMFYDAEPPRFLRSMVEKWSQTLPIVSTFFARCGQVVGVPENAERLLLMGEPLLVFPEGTRGINKPFSQRYQLEEFGLGFMRLALQTDTPIVPVAVIGAEEQYVNFGNISALASVLKMPSFPIVPQWFIPGLQLPLPTRYRLWFGEPLPMTGDPDDDDAVIGEKVEVVRSTIQSMLNRGLKERTGVFW